MPQGRICPSGANTQMRQGAACNCVEWIAATQQNNWPFPIVVAGHVMQIHTRTTCGSRNSICRSMQEPTLHPRFSLTFSRWTWLCENVEDPAVTGCALWSGSATMRILCHDTQDFGRTLVHPATPCRQSIEDNHSQLERKEEGSF